MDLVAVAELGVLLGVAYGAYRLGIYRRSRGQVDLSELDRAEKALRVANKRADRLIEEAEQGFQDVGAVKMAVQDGAGSITVGGANTALAMLQQYMDHLSLTTTAQPQNYRNSPPPLSKSDQMGAFDTSGASSFSRRMYEQQLEESRLWGVGREQVRSLWGFATHMPECQCFECWDRRTRERLDRLERAIPKRLISGPKAPLELDSGASVPSVSRSTPARRPDHRLRTNP